jgi:hypothetical protein
MPLEPDPGEVSKHIDAAMSGDYLSRGQFSVNQNTRGLWAMDVSNPGSLELDLAWNCPGEHGGTTLYTGHWKQPDPGQELRRSLLKKLASSFRCRQQ